MNTLWVPIERSLRKRSASLNSMRNHDFKTINPQDKYITPRPAPPVPWSLETRLGTSPAALRHDRSGRSESPTPSMSWPWSPRRLFSRKSSSRPSDRDILSEDEVRPGSSMDDWSSAQSSEGSRSRDISPESLRRFLVEDAPFAAEPADLGERPSVVIPEDIAEENEDDENFATSASFSETMMYTGLSPPPLPRGASTTTVVHQEEAATDETPQAEVDEAATFSEPPARAPPQLPTFEGPDMDFPQSHFSVSSDASSVRSPLSPHSLDSNDLPSFYHSESEDEDTVLAREEDGFPFQTLGGVSADGAFGGGSLMMAFSGYRLPRTEEGGKLAVNSTMGSPALIARNDPDLPVGNTSLLAAPAAAASGLDDLVHELGWMADVISGKGGA